MLISSVFAAAYNNEVCYVVILASMRDLHEVISVMLVRGLLSDLLRFMHF